MITAYLKPTNHCNVGCSHCYLPEDVRADKTRMTDEAIHASMRLLREMKDRCGHGSIALIWHGGEPLSLGRRYFENAGKIIDEYFSKNELFESVQTSLIPFSKEYAELAKERWGGSLGASMDFSSRKIKGSSEAYADLWLSKANEAADLGLRVIPNVVPNKVDAGRGWEIYDWFAERGFGEWHCERLSDVGGLLDDVPTNREYSGFLSAILDKCFEDWNKSGKSAYVKPIWAVFGGILHDSPGERWGGTCQSDFVVVNPDGTLNNCPDKMSFEGSYGSAFDGFSAFESSSERRKWIRIQQAGHRISECESCENASWCRSGCPITPNGRKIDGRADDCSGFKEFVNKARELTMTKDGMEFATRYHSGEIFRI